MSVSVAMALPRAPPARDSVQIERPSLTSKANSSPEV
jgi:hypothetical protein